MKQNIELLAEFVFESEKIAGISNDKEEIKRQFLESSKKFSGHVGAIIFLQRLAKNKNRFLTEGDVKRVNELVLKEQAEKWPAVLKFNQKAAGQYIDEIIPSDRFFMIDRTICSPRQVAGRMRTLISEINEWQENIQFGYVYNLHKMADFHYQFGLIRPFIDGNGRTGRALTLYLMFFSDKMPFVFNNEDIYSYYLAFFRRDEELMEQYFFKKAGLV
ncbi:MAG: Fic family protein [Candidatus Niyogibacteria bacterium]|nr:Fic family protein [Candidatus Niyogibacteria bacterium]